MDKIYGYKEKDIKDFCEYVKNRKNASLTETFTAYATLTGKSKGTIRNMYYAIAKKSREDENFCKKYFDGEKIEVFRGETFNKADTKELLKKVDLKKERYLMFIDTETIGTLNVKESILPFEIGMKILDTETMKVVKEKSYLVRKFFNNKYIMLSTFSATKYPNYFEKLENDKRYKTMSVNDISKDIEKTISRYAIKIMVAHNGNFDKTAMARLFEDFGVNNPFENIDLLDTMELSKIITFSKDYANYCLENKDRLNSMKDSCFITNSGRVRTTAQAIYCYISNNSQFEEAHTGLEDIDIEIEIFKYSLNLLGNTIVSLNTAPSWRDYSKVVEED